MGMRTTPYYLSEEQRSRAPQPNQRRLYDDTPLQLEDSGALLKENIRDNRDVTLEQKRRFSDKSEENTKEMGRIYGQGIAGTVDAYQKSRNDAVNRRLAEENIVSAKQKNDLDAQYGAGDREAQSRTTRAGATTAEAGAQYAGKREELGVRGAEAGVKTAEVEAKGAERKQEQQLSYQELLNDQAKANTSLANMSVEEKRAEMAYQNTDAAKVGLVGAKEGETIRQWIMRTDVELKQTSSQHAGAELKLKEQQLAEAVKLAPLNRAMMQSQIAGNYSSIEANNLAGLNSKLDFETKRKDARIKDIGSILRSTDPKTLALVKDYRPEEVAEALHRNKLSDTQAKFIEQEMLMKNPEYRAKYESKVKALQLADSFKDIVGDLKTMQRTYQQDDGNLFDSAAAENDRDKIADYFDQAGEKVLAQQVRKGWNFNNATRVRTAISQGISRIQEQANGRLKDYAGESPSIQQALTSINGVGEKQQGVYNPFDVQIPAFNQKPPVSPNGPGAPYQGPAVPQFIQGTQPQPPQQMKTMRPSANVKK